MNKSSTENHLSNFLTALIVISILGIISNIILYALYKKFPGIEDQIGISHKVILINLVLLLIQILSNCLILKHKKIGVLIFLISYSAYTLKNIVEDPNFFIIPMIIILSLYSIFYLLIRNNYKYMT